MSCKGVSVGCVWTAGRGCGDCHLLENRGGSRESGVENSFRRRPRSALAASRRWRRGGCQTLCGNSRKKIRAAGYLRYEYGRTAFQIVCGHDKRGLAVVDRGVADERSLFRAGRSATDAKQAVGPLPDDHFVLGETAGRRTVAVQLVARRSSGVDAHPGKR